MSLDSEHTMRVVLERLNWPVLAVRWQAAKSYAALFSTSQRNQAIAVFLKWLNTRQLEMEVVSGLCVLLCTGPKDLPSSDEVQRSILTSSILADLLFHRIYHKPLGGWALAHSGPAPDSFVADQYFEKNIGQMVPPILESDFRDLEDESGFPFRQQWAFEWRQIMDRTGSPHSSFPYHFMNMAGGREGIVGQFNQGQCNVYRSAFLRTLALAVSYWGMPPNYAAKSAKVCLPLNRGLHAISPGRRPAWLKTFPEDCCRPGASIEEFARKLVTPGTSAKHMRPISLRIPIRTGTVEFGELAIDSFYTTTDFVPPASSDEALTRMTIWTLRDRISFDGVLPDEDPSEYQIEGTSGSCLPVCLQVFPNPLGFWMHEYVRMGIFLPAAYNFSKAPRVRVLGGKIRVSDGARTAAQWLTWNDDWVPTHPREGRTRCGGITQMNTAYLDETAKKLHRRLAWHARLNVWSRNTEYGAPQLSTQSVFFHD